MKKMILILVSGLLIACTAGSALADPFDAALWNTAGTAPADTSLDLKPGDSTSLSFHLTKVLYPDSTYAYSTPVVTAVGGDPSDIIVTFTEGSFTPNLLSFNPADNGYTHVGAIKIELKPTAPVGAHYSVEIRAASETATVGIDSGSASRNINSIPEFPTVALPVAALIGLVFVFGRKKEGL